MRRDGTIVAVYSADGTKLLSYTYDAFGNKTTKYLATDTGGGAYLNYIGYRGYYYDYDLGLYFTQTRLYDPTTGRFISSDRFDVIAATPDALTDKNLYIYCDNDPVNRVDPDGEFWHIIVGAVAGALISGVVQVISNAIEGKVLTDGLAVAMGVGAISGALASTGVGIGGAIAGNAALSMVENTIDQVVDNQGFNNFDVGAMLIDGVIGGISGAIGGAGKGSKHLTNLGKQTVKRTFKATTKRGLRTGLKEAGKAFAYYGKNTAKYYLSFVKGFPVDFVSTVGTTIASNYMQHQYQHIFGR